MKEEGIDVGQQPEAGAAAHASSTLDSSPLSSVSEESAAAGEAEEEDSDGGSSSRKQQQWVEQLLASAVCVQEAGVKFLATPEGGQKTGFYADQRANRALVASMAAGKTVLDLCCYSGGFGLMAAAAGAAAVTGVDTSPNALQLAQANAEMNGLADRCVRWACGGVLVCWHHAHLALWCTVDPC